MTDPTLPPAPLLTMTEQEFDAQKRAGQLDMDADALLAELTAQRAALATVTAERDAWRNALDELHVVNWIGVIDGLTPHEAVGRLLEQALDQERDALRIDRDAAYRQGIEDAIDAAKRTAHLIEVNYEMAAPAMKETGKIRTEALTEFSAQLERLRDTAGRT